MRARIVAPVIAAFSLLVIAVAPNAGAQSWEIKTCNGDGAVRSTPENVWPPNHKMHSVTLAYTESESDGDTATERPCQAVGLDDAGHRATVARGAGLSQRDNRLDPGRRTAVPCAARTQPWTSRP